MKPRLTDEQFRAAVALTSMRSERAINGARAVLVDGRTLIAAAHAEGISMQAVHRASMRIRNASASCPLCGRAHAPASQPARHAAGTETAAP